MKRLLFITSLLALPFCLIAAETPPAENAGAAASEPLKPRNDLAGLANFARISEGLYRGAQPTAEGFRTLKQLGIKTIVNLRSLHSDRDKLKGTGLQYVHINCKAWHPEQEDVLKFLKVLSDPKNQPVFVHCQHGADRTGMMVAAFRITQQNWTAEKALEELPVFGFHEIFEQIKQYLRALSPDDLKNKLKKTAMPQIDVIE